MSKFEILVEIQKLKTKIDESQDPLTKLMIEHHELSPLYRELGKLVYEEMTK